MDFTLFSEYLYSALQYGLNRRFQTVYGFQGCQSREIRSESGGYFIPIRILLYRIWSLSFEPRLRT